MNNQEINAVARRIGLTALRFNKTYVIHQIQSKEGNFACYASATQGVCDQLQCLWRQDCLTQSSLR